MKEKQLGSVISKKKTQRNQKRRSSEDFSIKGAKKALYLKWDISDTIDPDKISFKVMCDKSMASDPYLFDGDRIRNGDTTKSVDKNIDQRKLYIAKPRGAEKNFLVTVYGNFD